MVLSTSTLSLTLLSTLLPLVSTYSLPQSEPISLKSRATISCSATTDCTRNGYAIPQNSHYYCAKRVCSWACNTNYVASGSKCVRRVTTTSVKPVTTTTSKRTTTTTTTKKLTTTTSSKTSPASSKLSTISPVQQIITTLAPSPSSSASSASSSSLSLASSSLNTTSSTSTTSTLPAPTQPAAIPSLVRTYQGSTFFDNWWWLNTTDPTHGSVTYVAKEDSMKLGLTSVSDSGTAIIGIDRTSQLALGDPRNSARISTLDTYNPGSLIIIDLLHVPHGCGVWPAFWMFQMPWPDYGEIDVYEGVGSRTFNQYTLHTAPGCTRNTAKSGTGVGGGTNCYAYGGTDGCTGYDYDRSSYGAGFNSAGGGVYAVQIAETGISIWRWPRSRIPSDVKSGAPRPQTWGTPVALWDGATCDTRTYFKWQMLTFDITTCGDWAGVQSVWESQQMSGNCFPKYANCAAANMDPASFSEAYFEVNYIKVFSV